MNCLICNIKTNNPKYCSLSCQMKHRNTLTKEKNIQNYYNSPNYCKQCSLELTYHQRFYNFCSRSCSASYHNLYDKTRKRGPDQKVFSYCSVKFLICEQTGKPYCNKNERGFRRQQSPYVLTTKQSYYDKCRFRFNVYNYPGIFDLSLIEKYGWYTCPGKKRSNYDKNINGVSRDHIISISEGFKNNYDPYLISHPMNCRLVLQSDNKKKQHYSNMSIDELKIEVEKFDLLYLSNKLD